MAFIFLLFLIVPIVIVVLVFSHKYRQETKMNWYSAAQRLKLHFTPGNMISSDRLTGKLHGHRIDVSTFTRKSGDSSRTYTQYRVTYNKPIPTHFKLTKQSLLHGLGKVFGMQDVELGDPGFDNSVLVKGQNPAAIARFLTVSRRKHIKKAILMFPEITITDKSITIAVRGRDRITSTIISRIKFLCSLSNAIVKDYDEDHPISKVKKARKEGEVKKAIEIVEQVKLEDEDEKLEAKEQEAELRYLAGETEKAAELFEDIKKEISADVPASQWQKHAETAEIPAAVTDTIEYEPDENEKEQDLTCDAVCKELFESGSTSTFDMTQKFEKEFKDKEISWEGEIENASKFSYDYVFRNTKGVKLSVFVHKILSSFGDPKVHAIIHFPTELFDALSKQKGKKLRFTGKMAGVDALMHNIYITDGQIKKA